MLEKNLNLVHINDIESTKKTNGEITRRYIDVDEIMQELWLNIGNVEAEASYFQLKGVENIAFDDDTKDMYLLYKDIWFKCDYMITNDFVNNSSYESKYNINSFYITVKNLTFSNIIEQEEPFTNKEGFNMNW